MGMWKSWLRMGVTVVWLFLALGCTPTRYEMFLRDGSRFTTRRWPVLDEGSGQYRLLGLDGQWVLVRESAVSGIQRVR